MMFCIDELQKSLSHIAMGKHSRELIRTIDPSYRFYATLGPNYTIGCENENECQMHSVF